MRWIKVFQKRGVAAALSSWRREQLKMKVLMTQAREYPGTGAGAGKDEGPGGSVREAGGGLSRLGVANEEGYFYNKEKEKLEKLKKKLKSEPEKHHKEDD